MTASLCNVGFATRPWVPGAGLLVVIEAAYVRKHRCVSPHLLVLDHLRRIIAYHLVGDDDLPPMLLDTEPSGSWNVVLEPCRVNGQDCLPGDAVIRV